MSDSDSDGSDVPAAPENNKAVSSSDSDSESEADIRPSGAAKEDERQNRANSSDENSSDEGVLNDSVFLLLVSNHLSFSHHVQIMIAPQASLKRRQKTLSMTEVQRTQRKEMRTERPQLFRHSHTSKFLVILTLKNLKRKPGCKEPEYC